MKKVIVSLLILGVTPGAWLRAQQSTTVCFNRQAIIVAYYASPQWSAVLKQKQAELESARSAHDQQKINELNAWGTESQKTAGQQLAGKAPIRNILERLKPAMRDILHRDTVSELIEVPPAGGIVDCENVTDRLLNWLKASDKTRRTIEGLPKMAPIAIAVY